MQLFIQPVAFQESPLLFSARIAANLTATFVHKLINAFQALEYVLPFLLFSHIDPLVSSQHTDCTLRAHYLHTRSTLLAHL